MDQSTQNYIGWQRHNIELHFHVFMTACVWDAALRAFERQAWVDTMLNNPNRSSIEAYLSMQMNEDV